jgi:hypothetical protein
MQRDMRVVVAIVVVTMVSAACGSDAGPTSARPSRTSASSPPRTSTTTIEAITTTSVPFSDVLPVRADGIGALRVGMTLAGASDAIDRPVELDPSSLVAPDATCGYAQVAGIARGLLLMVVRERPGGPWRIGRFDVVEPSRARTDTGIGIDATEDDVRAAYDNVVVEPHPYQGPDAHYLVIDPDGAGGLLTIFETSAGRVTRFRSGSERYVRAIEGCA